MEPKNIQEAEQQETANPLEGFEKVYTDINSPGSVWRHELVLTTVNDYSQVYEIAVDFAKRACTVKILPILNQKDPLRLVLFKGAKENKCPDMLVESEGYVDVKTLEGSISNANINNNIKKAKCQANYIVIRIPGDVDYWRLELIARKRFELHSKLQIITFKLISIRDYTFRRKDFV